MRYLGSITLNVINMVVIITCFDRKDILTCFVFTGCLVLVKGEIKKKQSQVRMLSVSFLIRTPGKGSDKTEMENFTAMPVQVTQIRLDLNQVKNCFAIKRIANLKAQFAKNVIYSVLAIINVSSCAWWDNLVNLILNIKC